MDLNDIEVIGKGLKCELQLLFGLRPLPIPQLAVRSEQGRGQSEDVFDSSEFLFPGDSSPNNVKKMKTIEHLDLFFGNTSVGPLKALMISIEFQTPNVHTQGSSERVSQNLGSLTPLKKDI